MRLRFRHSDIGTFFQAKPVLQNPYTSDAFLRRFLKRILPVEIFQHVESDFTKFGNRICTELDALGDECEARPPYLQQFDPWGNRIDQVVTCDAWKKMKGISAEEGLVAIPYEGKFDRWARVIQFAKLYLYHPSSGLYSCPLAMTDGASKTIKELKLSNLQDAFMSLTSRSPETFWTSGQWMTERRGGSDVGNGTETVAIPIPNSPGKFELHGYKWFSSATDSDMSFTLARIAKNQDAETTEGSAGLSMFFIKTRRDDGTLNNIHVMKLKNKLGTRQLPTGELLLDGTEAILASAPGRGVASISNMLTITRIHNASASVSSMRRIVSLSRDYSKRRECFGHKIGDFPIHVDTLADLELETRAGTALLLEVARLLGSVEHGGSEEDENLLRLLTPIVKLYTGKRCVGVVSEGIESFGGQGYIEDTGLPRLLRDAQVTPIWEGTTNILSMDVLRAILKSKGQVLTALHRNTQERLQIVAKKAPEFQPQVDKLMGLLIEILGATRDPALLERGARDFAVAIAQVSIGTLLLEQATFTEGTRSDRTAAIRWVQKLDSLKRRLELLNVAGGSSKESSELVYDGYQLG